MSSSFFLGCCDRRVSVCVNYDCAGRTYLLGDEVFVIVLDVELAFHFLDLSALEEQVSLYSQHLLAGYLALVHQSNQLPGVLEFLAKTPKLLRTLSITAASLADLANLTSAEADIGITIVGILTGFKLHSMVSNCA